MRRLLSPRPVVAAVAVAVLALGACAEAEDVTKSEFRADLEERTGVSEAVATCLTDAIYDEYDQDEVNRIYRAATEDELGNERRDELVAINQRCFEQAGEGAGSDGSEGGS